MRTTRHFVTSWPVAVVVYVVCAFVTYPVSAVSTCEPSGLRPSIIFTVVPGQARYFNNKSKKDLSSLRQSFGQNTVGWSPIGWTTVTRGWSIGVKTISRQLPEGWYCTEVTTVESTVQYHSIDVYVAREYPRGTCQYNSILDHERQHVGVFHDTLDELAPRMEQALHNVLNKMEPVRNKDRNRVVELQQSMLEEAMGPLFKELDRVTANRNGRLDTVENYKKESENCLSW